MAFGSASALVGVKLCADGAGPGLAAAKHDLCHGSDKLECSGYESRRFI